MRKLTAAQKGDAVERYAAGQGAPQIAADLGVSAHAMWSLLRRRGVTMRSNREAHTKHTLWHDAFDVLSPDAAYWCGFLFADGTLMPARSGNRRSNSLGIALVLAEQDRAHVEKFRAFLNSTHAITPVRPGASSYSGQGSAVRGASILYGDTPTALDRKLAKAQEIVNRAVNIASRAGLRSGQAAPAA